MMLGASSSYSCYGRIASRCCVPTFRLGGATTTTMQVRFRLRERRPRFEMYRPGVDSHPLPSYMEPYFYKYFRQRVEARAAFKKRKRARNFTDILEKQYGLVHVDDVNHFWYIRKSFYQEEDFLEYTKDPESPDPPEYIDRKKMFKWLDLFRSTLVWNRHQINTPGQKTSQECLQVLRYAYGVEVDPQKRTWKFTKDFGPPGFDKFMKPEETEK